MAIKRLYIGGLGHTITQKDLKDRFGKFGDVQDMELLTRKDDDGVPYKTFAYINIDISDAEYKRCVTVLNKSKWKGGTLQIEVAKESFLHRLAQERQQATEKPDVPEQFQKENLLETLKDVGVENYHMTAAVPGTEVPGHKDWIVSKFGRVLPILHLKCQGKKNIIKYDPSKHSHNIKKLNNTDDSLSLRPLSQLTWEIQEANDEISKKRRGEFPPHKAHSTKIKKDFSSKLTANSHSDLNMNGEDQKSTGYLDKGKKGTGENGQSKQKQKPAPRTPLPPSVRIFDGDDDSDTEIRSLVSQQHSQDGLAGEEEEDDDDKLEVVGDDYMPMAKRSCPLQKAKPNHQRSEEDYDSADTDEIITSRKASTAGPEQEESASPWKSAPRPVNGSEKRTAEGKTSGKKVLSKVKPRPPELQCVESDEEGDDEESEESGDSDDEESEESGDSDDEESEESGDSDYETMFTDCHRLEISLADLEQLAKESSNKVDEDSEHESEEEAGPSQVSEVIPVQNTVPSKVAVPKKGTTPEEILASLLRDDRSDEDTRKKKKKNSSTPLPAFQGTKHLTGNVQDPEENRSLKRQLDDINKTAVSSKKQKLKTATDPVKVTVAKSSVATSSGGGSSGVLLGRSGGEDDSREEDGGSVRDSETLLAKQAQQPVDQGRGPQRGMVPEKQLQDNQKRLAAVEQRQKEAEQQKKLIQGALAKVDTPTTDKSKHIVFCSDDETDNADLSSSNFPTPKKTLFQSSEEDSNREELPSTKKTSDQGKKNASKLFGNSEDEEEDEAEDGEMFQIKPQFEGKSGQKLMHLQSRFGTDERFQLDSRFIESDDEPEASENKSTPTECEMDEEKKKNLDILQNLLKMNTLTTSSSKVPAKGQTFRDISALQYDPTREDHAAFETKTEQKESKAARRKKKEEAEKIPEVSKEIYYEVADDLKTVFGTAKPSENVEKKAAWDKEEEGGEVEEEGGQSQAAEADTSLLASCLSSNTEKEESSGFKFSFFGDSAEADNTEKEEYKVETLRAAKVSWQADPRFQDSSSEEEEEEADEDQVTAAKVTREEVTIKKKFFFFRPDDERLIEGPKAFCRTTKLEDQREKWEENRISLIEEYRKKHKDAKRKLKASQRTTST